MDLARWVNRKALLEVLRMYDVGGKLLKDIKSMYVNNVACVRVKRGDSKCFSINCGVRQGCIMSPLLFNIYMDAVMKEVKMGMGRRGVRFQEEGRKWRLPGLLCANDLVLYSDSEKDLKSMLSYVEEI